MHDICRSQNSATMFVKHILIICAPDFLQPLVFQCNGKFNICLMPARICYLCFCPKKKECPQQSFRSMVFEMGGGAVLFCSELFHFPGH
jgi:hypothetical protein